MDPSHGTFVFELTSSNKESMDLLLHALKARYLVGSNKPNARLP